MDPGGPIHSLKGDSFRPGFEAAYPKKRLHLCKQRSRRKVCSREELWLRPGMNTIVE